MTSPRRVIIGVDTHLDTIHVAAIADTGRLLGDAEFRTTPTGYWAAICWARSFGDVVSAGVEGTSSYGARWSHDQRTRDYVTRQLAAGRSKKDILRLLKRAIAREMFKHLTAPCPIDDYSDLRPTRQARNISIKKMPVAQVIKVISSPQKARRPISTLDIKFVSAHYLTQLRSWETSWPMT